MVSNNSDFENAIVIMQLLEELGSQDLEIQQKALDVLSKCGPEIIIRLLMRIPYKGNYGVPVQYVKLLQIIGKPATEKLCEIIIDGQLSDELKLVALRSLKYVADKSCTNALVQLSSNALLGSYALLILGELKDEQSVKPLIALLNTDGSDWMIPHVIAALGKIGDEQAVEPLIDVLESSTDSIDYHDVGYPLRVSAAEALAQIGDKRAVKPLVKQLKILEDSVRMQPYKKELCVALGKLGDESVIFDLAEVVNNPKRTDRPETYQAALEAINLIKVRQTNLQ